MTVAQFQTRILGRLDDPNGRYFSSSEVLYRLNEGQRLFALLTLCLEKTSTIALNAATPFRHLLSSIPDYLVPLRISVASGSRLTFGTLADLDAENDAWQKTAGAPTRYATLGLDLLAINKQPAGSGTSLDITHAYSPARLSAPANIPAIPEEYHLALADYAFHTLRIKEGGREFADTFASFQRFLADVEQCAAYVRQRSLAQRYDTLPFELRTFDRSRLVTPARPRKPRPDRQGAVQAA